jgi:hypothetical protein
LLRLSRFDADAKQRQQRCFYGSKLAIDNDGSGGNAPGDPAHQSATTLRDATGRSLDAEPDIFAVLPMDADEAERAHRDIPRSLSNTPVCRTSAGNLDLSWAI